MLLSPACASYDQYENFEAARRGLPPPRRRRSWRREPLPARSDDGEEQRATTLELFFDLVFVFAITQVSHILLDDLSWRGGAQALLVLMVVWWAWNYTTWVTNELDPDSTSCGCWCSALMFASLLMAVAIPEAFGDRAMLFAGVVRRDPGRAPLFLTFVVGVEAGRSSASAPRASSIWLAGGRRLLARGRRADGSTRAVLWLIAVAIDYGAPSVVYWVPGRPQLGNESWDVEMSHFAERFQLFIIIALGESIVLTGATTADLDLDAARMTGFALAFLATAAMWWLYFNYVAAIASGASRWRRTGRCSRVTATRTSTSSRGRHHLGAVGDELVIAHPTDVLPAAEVVVVAAGPAIYMIGHVAVPARDGRLDQLEADGRRGRLRPVGLLGFVVPALVLGTLLVAVFVAVIVSERVASCAASPAASRRRRERLDAQTALQEADG